MHLRCIAAHEMTKPPNTFGIRQEGDGLGPMLRVRGIGQRLIQNGPD
jgi:hypothetical protein